LTAQVDFLDAYVLELKDRPNTPICAVEKYIQGEYKKYNNNWDWCDEKRSTPQVGARMLSDADGC
jgi:elongation factor 2 kinase